MIDQNYLRTLPIDGLAALDKVVNDFFDFAESVFDPDSQTNTRTYTKFLEFFEVARLFENEIYGGLSQFEVKGNPSQRMAAIEEYFTSTRVKLTRRLAAVLRKSIQDNLHEPLVDFSDTDLKRVQTLLDEMRDVLKTATDIDEKYRRRLLLRLEKMQAELHKSMSDLDVFWGGTVDAAEALGKFGEKIKPFVDRMIEIKDIVWSNRAKRTGLPDTSETPTLPGRDIELTE
jgi:hypothetical protein